MRVKRDKPFPVEFSHAERDLILNHTFIDLNLERLLRVAETKGEDRIVVRISPDDLDVLLGFIAAEANHTTSKPLQTGFDALYDRLSDIEAEIELDDD